MLQVELNNHKNALYTFVLSFCCHIKVIEKHNGSMFMLINWHILKLNRIWEHCLFMRGIYTGLMLSPCVLSPVLQQEHCTEFFFLLQLETTPNFEHLSCHQIHFSSDQTVSYKELPAATDAVWVWRTWLDSEESGQDL